MTALASAAASPPAADKDFDRYLTVLASAGARTRSILYVGGVMFACMIIPWLEYEFHDWARERFRIISVAQNCVYDHLSVSASSPVP
jgi:hypothetical protein